MRYLKIQRIHTDDYIVYDYSNKIARDSVYYDIKNLFQTYQKKLLLRGFYHVKVYFHKIGVFIKIIKIDDSIYEDTLDLKIDIIDEFSLYYETKDYYHINEYEPIYYYKNSFYVLVDESFPIFDKIEFGNFIIEDEKKIQDGILI